METIKHLKDGIKKPGMESPAIGRLNTLLRAEVGVLHEILDQAFSGMDNEEKVGDALARGENFVAGKRTTSQKER